jgi:hypothetical protein
MPKLPSRLKIPLPNLSDLNGKQTSDATEKYNCIAWAYGANNNWFWPDPVRILFGACYWPPNIPCEKTVEAFIALFRSIGYEQCGDDSLEQGFEKITIYADGKKPTHAARQLPTGKWTSKLGDKIDIEHDSPDCLIGPEYGNPVVIMKRPTPAH